MGCLGQELGLGHELGLGLGQELGLGKELGLGLGPELGLGQESVHAPESVFDCA